MPRGDGRDERGSLAHSVGNGRELSGCVSSSSKAGDMDVMPASEEGKKRS